MEYDVKDLNLADKGKRRIEWADKHMPVLKIIRERFEKEKPLEGIRVSCCLHVTAETANLMRTLKAGGAQIALTASNPLSTQDDVAAALVKHYEISTFAIKGENNETYYSHLNKALDTKPNITMDDGGDLVSEIMKKRQDLLEYVIAGTEETTTGVVRFKSMEKQGVLKYPIIAVNDAKTKHFFDNRYGTGQSTLDGIIRATDMLIAGKQIVVAGYGWCGRGFATRARGMGGIVTVTEVNPLKAIEAVMDGFSVKPMEEVAKIADLICTLTGDINVVDKEDFEAIKDCCVVCNSGHFNNEINITALEEMKKSKKEVKQFVEEYTLKNGKKVYLLAEGRLINLAAAEGHPAAVMDMSFANQALSAEYLQKHSKELENKVYVVPKDLDEKIAELKLDSMGIEIDELTEEQKKYLESWEEGT